MPNEKPRRGTHALAGIIVAASSGLLIFSTFLTWGEDSGLISAYARRPDRDLTGQSFSGLSITGGNWFGIATLIVGVLGVLVGLRLLLGKRVKAGRLLGAEMGVTLGVTAVALPLAYLVTQPPDLAVSYSDGPGPVLALIAGIGLLIGAGLAAAATRFIPIHEEPRNPSRLAIGVGFGIVVLVIGLFSSWVYDERAPDLGDLAAQVRALVDEGMDEAVAAAQINELADVSRGARTVDGLAGDGPQLGFVLLVLGGLAAAAAAYRTMRNQALGERGRWFFDVALIALGAAIIGVGTAWIVSFVRLDENQLTAGVGSFFAMIAGLLIASAALPYIRGLLLAAPGD